MPSRPIRRVLPAVGVALLSASLGACSSLFGHGGQNIRPQLIRIAEEHATGAISEGDPPAGGSYEWSSAIGITSIRVPIRGITLRGGNTSTNIYTCAANSNDGCLVDLAGPSLQDLLGAGTVTVDAGTYDEVDISTCTGEGSYHAFLSGSVSLGGAEYVTRTSGVLAPGDASEPTQLEYAGCTRSYPLPVPLVVTDTAGAPIDFRLYFDMRDLAWASLGFQDTANGWLPGGCAGPRPGDPSTGGTATPYLCTGYPDVAGVVDNAVPSVERYRINGAATIGLLFRASGGQFVGGYSRRFFSEGVAANPGFNADTPVDEFTPNGDGNYHLSTFGGSGPGGVGVSHYVVFPAFSRASHSGTGIGQDVNPFTYTAVRLQ